MKIGGTEWHDPDNPGEGLDLFVYPDGQVIAKWYGYDSAGNQQWLIAVGTNNGGSLFLNANATGVVAQSIRELQWGQIKLNELQGNRLRVALMPNELSIAARAITMSPLHVSTNPAPDSSNPVIVIRNSQGHETGVPCEGAATRSGDKFTIEVLKGTLTIKDIASYGRFNPRLEGISKGKVLVPRDGGPYGAIFRLDAGWEQQGGAWEPAGLTVHTRELGPIFNLQAQVKRA